MINPFLSAAAQVVSGVPHLQQGDLQQSSLPSRRVAREAEAELRAARLEGRLDRLAMISAALWELLKEQTDLKEEDLFRRVEDIDLRDGVLDGKVTRQTAACGNCGRTISARHTQCLYCGTPRAVDTAFDNVF